MKNLVFIFLTLSTFSQVKATWRISYITPRLGSTNGGTQLTVFGSDFDTSLSLNSTNPNKKLYLSSDYRSYECNINIAASDEDQVVCETEPMPYGNYYIRMTQNEAKLPSNQYCDGNNRRHTCRFIVYGWRTPLLTGLSWRTGEAKQLLTIWGRLFTNKTSSGVVAATNGITAAIQRVYVGDGSCLLFNKSNNNEPFGVSLDGQEGESVWGNIKCLINDTFVGSRNVSYIVNEDFGRSLAGNNMYLLSAANQLYNLQTYAVITDVNPKQGSTVGGTELTIEGRGFYNETFAEAKVYVGGVVCDITEVTEKQIKCITRPQPDSEVVYSGGRGMIVEVFHDTSDLSASLISSNADRKFFTDSSHTTNANFLNENNFISRSRGFFIPAMDGNYQFIFKSDDVMQLRVNPNGKEPSGAIEVATTSGVGVYAYSKVFPMKAGVEYFYELRHKDYNIHAYFQLDIFTDKTLYTNAQTSLSITERQKVEISAPVVKETQTVVFKDWSSESAVESVWSLQLSCQVASCEGYGFSLRLFGTNSGIIEYSSDMTSSSILSVLNRLVVLGSDMAEVTGSNNLFTITFRSSRGHMPLEHDAPNSDLQISLTATAMGKPSLESFTFMVNGKVSQPVEYDASEDVVANAVKSLFGSICPTEVEGGISSRRLYYYDMEDNKKPSGTISSEDSYCGSFSLKNPWNLFNDAENSYSAQAYPDVRQVYNALQNVFQGMGSQPGICFAYKGNLATRVSVWVSYNALVDEELQPMEHRLDLYFSNEIIQTDNWKHICLNVFSKLNDVLGVLIIKISRVQIFRHSDVYLDNVFIGRSKFDSTDLQGFAFQIISAAVSHIKLESAEVEKTGNSYVITYSPFDCGFNFPLLGIAFGNKKAGSTSNFAEYEIGDGSATVQVHRSSSASLPVTGSFNLGFNDPEFQTLTEVPANISELELRNRLQTLNKIHEVQITRSGSCAGYSWEIQFISPAGNYPDLTADGDSLSTTPGPVTITPTSLTNGGLRMGPVYGDFFRTAHDVPQVQVFIQDIPSACVGSGASDKFDFCNFQWTEEATPIVTDLPTNRLSSGDKITITGSGFDPNPASDVVIIGGMENRVISSSETSLTFVVGTLPYGVQTLEIFVKSKGKGKLSISNNQITKRSAVSFDIEVLVEPSEESQNYLVTNGGTVLSFPHLDYGQYSADRFSISVGDDDCTRYEESCNDEQGVACTVPPGSGSAEIKLKWDKGNTTVPKQFTYSPPTCSISSATPSALKVNGGETVTITGYGFGTAQENVTVGCKTVEIITWENNEIVFTSPSLKPGSYQILVSTESSVCDPSNFWLAYRFEITSISPDTGSIAGGTEVTLTGIGLVENMTVRLDGRDYLVTNVSEEGTQATFVTGPSTSTHMIKNDGIHAQFGYGYAWNPSSIDIQHGDKVTFSWSQQNFIDTELAIDIFTVSSLFGERVYNEKGFQIPGSVKGTYTVPFNNVGTYYYTSKCLVGEEDSCELAMTGTINVTQSSQKMVELSASFNRTKAVIQNSIYFEFDPSITPIVDDISINEGYLGDRITLTGTNLDNVQEVFFGKVSVKSATSTNTQVVIIPDQSHKIKTGVNFEIGVRTTKGFALLAISSAEKRIFRLLPKVTSVTPSCVSLKGGANVTIEGSGFEAGSISWASGPECNINSVTYTSITCKTSPRATEWDGNLSIMIRDETAHCSGSSCSFSYKDICTPEVAEVTYSKTTPLMITIKGSKFGTESDDIELKLVGELKSLQANIQSVSDSKIVAEVSGFYPPGRYSPVLSHRHKGLAKLNGDASYVKSFLLNSIHPANGSIEGGQTVNLTGNGFIMNSTEVLLGDAPCSVSTTTEKTLTCITGKKTHGEVPVTVRLGSMFYETNVSYFYNQDYTPKVMSIHPQQGSAGDNVTLNGNFFTNEADDLQIKFDDVTCIVRTASESSVTCTLGQREAGTITPQVRVKGYGLATNTNEFTYNLGLQSVNLTQGSFGGGQTITLQGKGFSENMNVTICDKKCELVSGSMTSTQAECITPAMEFDPSSTTISCNVTVSLNNLESTRTGEYTYDAQRTCVVTGVTPDRGGTGGGTEITITGENFNDVTVSIDGSDCNVTTESEAQIVCTTNSHIGSIKTPVRVTCGSKGDAITGDTYFYYADRWSSRFTWGGNEPPKEGSFVVIPKGHTIILDSSTPVLKMLLVDGGELIFDNYLTKDGTTLNAENILIVNNGTLQIGTEEEPFLKKAEIVMHGNLRSPELPIYGAKTLGVREGKLDLHGKPVIMQWTMLNATANAKDTQITLEHPVDWNVGDQIVIASTGTRHSQEENEERKITAISDDKRTLTLDDKLDFTHLGITQTHCDTDIQYRAEVGLLTRNIVFRGSDDLQWHDDIPKCEAGFNTGQFATQTCFQGRFGEETGSDEFGASIMIHSQSPNTADKQFITARIENIEVTYAGQAFRLGRYPIHWHLMGNMSNSYVRSCAIHRTFNRAVTIHGTHNLLVEHNVVYNIMGGAIFIEDGIETGNIIQYNLAIFVRQSTSLLTEDITPAAYWVTNPDNIIRHNHGAGGTHFCFWYRMNEHPDGPSFTSSVCQQGVELGEFQNNTCHSQGWFGLWVFPTYFPVEGGSCKATTPSPAKFRSLTAWHCEKGAEWVNCGAIHFIDFVLADHEAAGLDLKLVKSAAVEPEQGALVENTAIVGHTAIHPVIETRYAIILPFSGNLNLNNICLENFNRGGAGFRVTDIQGLCTELCGGFEMYFRNMKKINVNKLVQFRWTHEAVLVDRDGTFLDGAPGSSLVPFTDIMDPNLCVIQDNDLYKGKSDFKAAICHPSVSFNRLAVNKVLPSSLEANDLYVENKHGQTSSLYAKKRLTHPTGWMILLQSNENYKMWWKDGEQFTNLTYNAHYYNFHPEDYLIITHVLSQAIDRVLLNGKAGVKVDSLSQTSSNGEYSFTVDTGRFSYVVAHDNNTGPRSAYEPFSSVSPTSLQHFPVTPKTIRCAVAGCKAASQTPQLPVNTEKPSRFYRWSNQNTSCTRDRCRVPRAADDSSLCWVVLDQSSTNCDNFTIEGVLEVDETKDSIILQARTIFIKGGILMAGTPNKTFTGNFDIVLTGNHKSKGFLLDVADLGQKALGVLGGLDLHGKPHNVYWTRLEQTANVGATTIQLEEEVDWEAGNEIVITTTGYRSQETEKRTIERIESNRKTIVLNQALEYRHLGKSYTLGDRSYSLKAEVGLLTRNIRIIGEEYDEIDDEAFGARVLVAGGIEEDSIYSGWARASNVEFHRTGQEGWTEPYDPRFSLVWLNTGPASDSNPSYAIANAFHDGYSTAIGTFGADGIEIRDNVVHRTIHDGIRITGKNHILKRNLVAMSLFRGAWRNRFELTNFKDWHASFEISQAVNITLEGNVAAGSERIGFHTDGEACNAPESPAWKDNVAHGCLHGLHIFLNDGIGDCSMLRNFLVYKSWDYGVYFQTPVSVVVRNTIVVDSVVSFMPIIVGPPSLSHAYADKCVEFEDVSCVGRSPHFNSAMDYMDEKTDKNLLVRSAGPDRKAPRNPTAGSTCIVLPIFASASNNAPFKGFHFQISYPALLGSFSITGLYAGRYQTSGGRRDLVIWTCPTNEDANHPVITQGTRFFEVGEENKILIDRASLGKVNPSDCVDMECDAKKKVLIKDLDGSFLGESGAIISQSEYAWGVKALQRRGLGDYRIPKTLLTKPNGDRIEVQELINHRGIIRTPNCVLNQYWQAYECSGDGTLDYRMLVIESMDDDTETRRLSPVAVIGDKYIDLINGPQDHGWCFGYTCQLRISTFWAIVANNKNFEIYFTGYAPRHLRLRVLRSGTCSANGIDGLEQTPDIAIRVAIFYARPERLDIHLKERGNIYIHPRNSRKEGDKWVLKPIKDIPPIEVSGRHGENYFDPTTNLQYVLLRDEDPIDIFTSPAVYVKIGLQAISIDDFFGENLLSNVAKFLNVPKDNIHIVNIVRESSRRKRSETSLQQAEFTLMFSSTITNDSSIEPEDPVAIETFNNGSKALIVAMQSNVLSEVVNGTIASFVASVINRNLTGDADEVEIVYTVPTTLSVTSLPSTVEEYTKFPKNIMAILLDINQNPVATLDDVFEVTVTLDKSINGADPSAMLLGDTSVMFTNGSATFTNLMISHQGTYKLNFQVTKPVNVLLNATNVPSLVVTQRTVNLGFPELVPNYIIHGQEVKMTLQLLDSALHPLQNVGFKGHTWKLEVSFDDSSIYNARLGQTTTFTFNNADGTVVTTGLQLIDTTSFMRYILRCRAYTEPSLYDIDTFSEPITFVLERERTNPPIFTKFYFIRFAIRGQPHLPRSTASRLHTFVNFIYNSMVNVIDTNTSGIRDVNSNISSGNTELSFQLSAINEEIGENSIQKLEKLFNGSLSSLSYQGLPITFADPFCGLQIDSVCRNTPPTSAVPADINRNRNWIFIAVGIGVALILAALIIAIACVMKRAKVNKIGLMGGRCLDANSSRGSSPLMDSFGGSTSMNTPENGSKVPNISHWDRQMTPVQN